jgi:aminobenzoyl-glutamate transport protein
VGICGFFVPSASTKWAIMSPIMVPMFMQNSLTPEFAQAVFRAADSSIKGMTPLFTYFVILIGFLQIYNSKKKDSIGLVDAMGLMVPYTIAFSILWLLILIAFYIIGLPLGFNAGVML